MPLDTVGSSTGHSCPLFHDPMDTRSYESVAIQGMGDINLVRSWGNRCRDIRELIQSVAACASGRTLLNDIHALSKQGAQIAIGPLCDSDTESSVVADDHAHVEETGGQILWRLEYEAPWWRIGTFNPKDVKSVIEDLVRVRNLAAERLWPGVPPLSSEDVASAFLAELVLCAAPALGEWRFDSFAPLEGGFDPLLGANSEFDSLDGIMPMLGDKSIRAELIDVLKLIKETLIGERLLKALQVYGRSCAVISIDPIGTENRAYSFTVAGGTWFVRKSLLAQRAKSKNLTHREAYASGFFENLLRARRRLAESLGMLKDNIDDLAIQKQFEAQLIERRQARIGFGARQSDSLRSNGFNGFAWAENPSVRTAPPLPPKKAKAPADQNPGASSGRNATAAEKATTSAKAESAAKATASPSPNPKTSPARNGRSTLLHNGAPANIAAAGTASSATAYVPTERVPTPPPAPVAGTDPEPRESGRILRTMWNSARRVFENRGEASTVNIPAPSPAVPNKYTRIPDRKPNF